MRLRSRSCRHAEPRASTGSAQPAVPLVADLPLESYEDQAAAAAAAPCLLLVEQPSDLRAAHRVVDFQNVASLYQTGVRSERNPDYDAAQASLKEAERESKRRGLSILQVGDPMLDLVGLLVGGVIATFDQFGSNGDLDDEAGGAEGDAALAAIVPCTAPTNSNGAPCGRARKPRSRSPARCEAGPHLARPAAPEGDAPVLGRRRAGPARSRLRATSRGRLELGGIRSLAEASRRSSRCSALVAALVEPGGKRMQARDCAGRSWSPMTMPGAGLAGGGPG